jgi:hypothetical protein
MAGFKYPLVPPGCGFKYPGDRREGLKIVCAGGARGLMGQARSTLGAAKELRGGLKYSLVPPVGAINSLLGARAGFPRILPEAGYCGDIARGFMGDGERTGSGAAKELRGGFKYASVPPGCGLKYPWDRRGTAINTPGTTGGGL